MTLPGIAGTPAAGQPAARAGPRHRPPRGRDGRRRPPAEPGDDARVLPQRDRRAGRVRRLDQRRGPPARDRRPPRRRPHPRGLRPHRAPACRCSSTCSPPGRSSWRTCTARAACSPCCARSPTCSTRRRSPSPGGPLVELPRRRPHLGRDGDPARAPHRSADDAGIAVLRGTLAPDGAVIKTAAASPHLLRHRGRAVVFDSVEDLHARIDDPDLDVDEDSVLVLRGCGPRGYPGMPEVANMPLPKKLLERGRPRPGAHQRRPDERDGVRHRRAARRARVGRRAVRSRCCASGDVVVLDVPGRRLDVDVPADEWAARRPSAAAADALRRSGARLGTPLRRPRPAGRHRRRPRLPRRQQRGQGRARVPLTSGATAGRSAPGLRRHQTHPVRARRGCQDRRHDRSACGTAGDPRRPRRRRQARHGVLHGAPRPRGPGHSASRSARAGTAARRSRRASTRTTSSPRPRRSASTALARGSTARCSSAPTRTRCPSRRR